MDCEQLNFILPVPVLKCLSCDNSQSYLVLLEYENLELQDRMTNVWKIDCSGNTVWKIQPLFEDVESKNISVWTNIWETEDGYFKAYNYLGYEAVIELASGKLLNRRFTK
jgi:hypothetical protein